MPPALQIVKYLLENPAAAGRGRGAAAASVAAARPLWDRPLVADDSGGGGEETVEEEEETDGGRASPSLTSCPRPYSCRSLHSCCPPGVVVSAGSKG